MARASALSEHETKRRRILVAAARECFLTFGFAKTSLDDIAKKASVSRPLIYRSFKNKEDLLAAVFVDTFEQSYPEAEVIVAGRGTKREKLRRLGEVLLVEPWEQMARGAMLAEFYAACDRLLPEAQARFKKSCLKYVRAVVREREVAEVFLLAVEGLTSDLPKTSVLRRRLELLVDRFV